MNPVPSAPTNWSAVPANWTVTDGNITGIKCNQTQKPAAARISFYECNDRLGHDRGVCFGALNGSDVCSCYAFSGWDYSCSEAKCTYGTVSGCATRATRIPSHFYLNTICLFAQFSPRYAHLHLRTLHPLEGPGHVQPKRHQEYIVGLILVTPQTE